MDDHRTTMPYLARIRTSWGVGITMPLRGPTTGDLAQGLWREVLRRYRALEANLGPIATITFEDSDGLIQQFAYPPGLKLNITKGAAWNDSNEGLGSVLNTEL